MHYVIFNSLNSKLIQQKKQRRLLHYHSKVSFLDTQNCLIFIKCTSSIQTSTPESRALFNCFCIKLSFISMLSRVQRISHFVWMTKMIARSLAPLLQYPACNRKRGNYIDGYLKMQKKSIINSKDIMSSAT